MNYLNAVISGLILWIQIFVLFTIINFIPELKESEITQNLILYVLLIVFTYVALHLYYKKDTSSTNGITLGVIMAATGLILDSVITLPLVIIPKGGSYKEFYTDPYLLIIIIEIIVISALYCKLVAKHNEQEK